MNVKLQWDAQAFATEAKRIAAFSNRSLKDVLRQQAALGAIDCMRMTAPFGKSPLKESYGTQRRHGLDKTRSDILRAFKPLNKIGIVGNTRSEGMKKEVQRLRRQRNWLGMESLLRTFGIFTLGIIQEATGQLLDQLRNKRGNVRKKVNSYLVISAPSITRLIKERQAKVGLAKSGWNKALIALGRSLDIPGWVKEKHGEGIFAESPAGEKQDILIGNAVRYIQYRTSAILDAAMRERQRAATFQAATMERAIQRKLREQGLQ